MKFGIGQAVKRVEDKVLITGTGNFTDDVNVGEGMAIHFVRSAHAHANIKYINFEEASKRSGVKLIATQKELDDGLAALQKAYDDAQTKQTTDETSGKTKLKNLGLTDDEIKALIGK